nr:CzcE family metal-binding protein [uncultured Roseateles sp.]
MAIATSLFVGVSAQAAPPAERLMNGNSIYGVPFAGQKTDFVVDLDSRRAINIECGQTVLFRQGGKTFAWKFDVVGHKSVDLSKIAPAGFSDKAFRVYVDKNEGERA